MVKKPLLLALSGGAAALALITALFISAAPGSVSVRKGPTEEGSNKRALFGAGEYRDGLYTPSIEEFLKRAYPLDDVPPGATTAARNGWAARNTATWAGTRASKRGLSFGLDFSVS